MELFITAQELYLFSHFKLSSVPSNMTFQGVDVSETTIVGIAVHGLQEHDPQHLCIPHIQLAHDCFTVLNYYQQTHTLVDVLVSST